MAAETKTSLAVDAINSFFDNTSGAITPAALRVFLLNLVTSYLDTNTTPASTTAPANTVLAGPTSGGAAVPTFRGLTATDVSVITTGNTTVNGTWTFANGQTPIILENGGPGLNFHSLDSTGYYTGTATGGGASTIVIPATNNIWTNLPLCKNDSTLVGSYITITGGTSAGDYKPIASYDATTRTITITGTFTSPPNATSSYSIGRLDYGWYRWIVDRNLTAYEDWEQPVPGTSTPFTQQDEFIRVNRWIHNVSFNYPWSGNGNRAFSMCANYVWNADPDHLNGQTAQLFSWLTLNASADTGNTGDFPTSYPSIYGYFEAMRLTPHVYTTGSAAVVSGPYFWTANGVRFGVGTQAQPDTVFEARASTTAVVSGATADGSTIAHFVGASGGLPGRILIDAVANAALITGRRSNGSFGAPASLAAGDQIVGFNAFGFGSTAFASGNAGGLNINAAENWTDAAHGTTITLQTTASGSVTPATRMTLFADGAVAIATGTDPGANALSIAGNIFTLVDRGMRFANATTTAGTTTATLTNFPVAGNPSFFLKINVNTTNLIIPCWTG